MTYRGCARLVQHAPAYRKTHHLKSGVGHYGVFNRKRWESQTYAVVRNQIRSAH
jgi:poly-beta-hydroxyalkanoate depolymerase